MPRPAAAQGAPRFGSDLDRSITATGGNYAFVYVNHDRCGSLGAADYSAETAVHELIHLLGAVPIVSAPPGPPHACPDDAAHVCDSPNDIVLPGGCCASLAETALDIGRDDYYGHGCSW